MPNCKYCFRSFGALHVWHLIQKPLLCRTCYDQLEWHHRIERWQGFQIESLLDYGPTFQKMIYQFKSNLDIDLAPVFLHQHSLYLKIKYAQFTLVPAPTHEQDLVLRGFHPLIEIFKSMHLPMKTLFEKNQPYRQSQQHGSDRQRIHQIVKLKEGVEIPSKILFVDDVMTTGETLRAMLKLINLKYPKLLKILVLARKKQEKNEITMDIKNDKIRNWK